MGPYRKGDRFFWFFWDFPFGLAGAFTNGSGVFSRFFRYALNSVVGSMPRYGGTFFAFHWYFRGLVSLLATRDYYHLVFQEYYLLVLGGISRVKVFLFAGEHFWEGEVLYHFFDFAGFFRANFRFFNRLFIYHFPAVFLRRVSPCAIRFVGNFRRVGQCASDSNLVHGEANGDLSGPPYDVDARFVSFHMVRLVRNFRGSRVPFLSRVGRERSPTKVFFHGERSGSGVDVNRFLFHFYHRPFLFVDDFERFSGFGHLYRFRFLFEDWGEYHATFS